MLTVTSWKYVEAVFVKMSSKGNSKTFTEKRVLQPSTIEVVAWEFYHLNFRTDDF
jgi:hypothetical protein